MSEPEEAEEGPAMSEPDVAVHDAIAAANIAVLTKATKTLPPFDGNLIRVPAMDPEENTPGLAVFVYGSGGSLDAPFIGGASSHKIEFVNVMVRSEHFDFAGGQTLAKAVRSALHYQPLSGYYSCTVADAQPTYLGRDERNRHMWSLSVETRRVVANA
jgi:hypothetical protein